MEHTYVSEAYAHSIRREMIEQGTNVSLVAYDGERGLYVFNSYSI